MGGPSDWFVRDGAVVLVSYIYIYIYMVHPPKISNYMYNYVYISICIQREIDRSRYYIHLYIYIYTYPGWTTIPELLAFQWTVLQVVSINSPTDTTLQVGWSFDDCILEQQAAQLCGFPWHDPWMVLPPQLLGVEPRTNHFKTCTQTYNYRHIVKIGHVPCALRSLNVCICVERGSSLFLRQAMQETEEPLSQGWGLGCWLQCIQYGCFSK